MFQEVVGSLRLFWIGGKQHSVFVRLLNTGAQNVIAITPVPAYSGSIYQQIQPATSKTTIITERSEDQALRRINDDVQRLNAIMSRGAAGTRYAAL